MSRGPFNGDRLRLLRQFGEYTQTDFANLIAVAQPTVADYERFIKEPTATVVEAIAAVGQVSPEFLFDQDDERFAEEEYNFRKRLTATERLKKKVAAQASLFAIVVRQLKTRVRFPELDIPSFPADSGDAVEESAERARTHWGLGLEGPITNMTRLLERSGVVVAEAEEETATKVDAFSRFGQTSVVVLNTAKESASRSFFDTAHETGHGILHFRRSPKPLDVREKEAERFAGAFLMPRRAFTKDFWAAGSSVTWAKLFELKRRWGTSLAAIIYRAYQLGLLDAAAYRSAFRALSRRGWRTAEPEEREPEKPELFSWALREYCKVTKQTTADFVRELHFGPGLFRAVTGVEGTDPKDRSITSLADHRRRRTVEQ